MVCMHWDIIHMVHVFNTYDFDSSDFPRAFSLGLHSCRTNVISRESAVQRVYCQISHRLRMSM